jgi:hypothetical protein
MMSWEFKEKNKVFTAILSVETVSTHWALGLRRLDIPGPEPITVAGMPFDHARNEAVKAFLQSPCSHLFFLDSDVVCPSDAVHRLLKWNRPIISGMYCRRSPPHAIPVMMRNHQWVTDIPGDPRNPLVEVDLVGSGCLLLSRQLMEEYPKVANPRPGKPWFDWRVDMKGFMPPHECLSEDFSFNYGVRTKMGIPIFVDTSIRCRHVGYAEADYGVFVPLGALPPPQPLAMGVA